MLLCVCVCVGGALTLKKACTRSRDTECGCKAGLRCGDGHCSFCVQECGKGQEPLPAARKTHLYLQTLKSYKLSGMPNKTQSQDTYSPSLKPLPVCLHRLLPELSSWDLQ